MSNIKAGNMDKLICCDCGKSISNEDAWYDENDNVYCVVCAEVYEHITDKITAQRIKAA